MQNSQDVRASLGYLAFLTVHEGQDLLTLSHKTKSLVTSSKLTECLFRFQLNCPVFPQTFGRYFSNFNKRGNLYFIAKLIILEQAYYEKYLGSCI